MSASREKKLRRELREAEQNSDIVKKTKKKKQQRSELQAQKLRSRIITTIVVLLLLAFAGLIFVNSGILQKNATAATVGSHKLSPVEFNYFYQDTYNNLKSTYTSYGMWSYVVDPSTPVDKQEYSEDQTWGEYIQQTALTNATQVYVLYDAAMAEGFTLSEDVAASLASLPESLESSAKQAGYKSADAYLEEFYGKGATAESYLEYIRVQQLASAYSTAKEESFSYSTEELQSYYTEHKTDFDTVTFRVFNVASGDDAKETADAMKAELDGTESGFIEAAKKYAPEDSKESYEDESYTLRQNYSYSSTSTDYADWLFADGRTAGENFVFSTTSGYSVVMFVSRDDQHYNTVNVRHILAQVAGSDDGSTTDEDWAACEERINEILAEWEAGEQTEDAFAALATLRTDDPGSSATGGLYEGVKKGQMVSAFNDWIFDENRKPGDYDVIKTEYGYHLMYYVGTGEENWISLVDEAKRSADYDSWFEAVSAKYAAETKWFGMLFTSKTLEP